LLATDAHHIDKRPPLLAEARDAAAKRLGDAEAIHLVLTRPRGILDNVPPNELPALPDGKMTALKPASGLWKRLFAKG